MRGRRRRPLTPEEQDLWNKVADSADPLHPQPKKPSETTGAKSPAPPPGAPPRKEASGKQPPVKPSKPAVTRPPSLATIDRRTRNRISRGSIPIDGRIDLHGSTQQEAHDQLLGFLRSTQAQNGRVVLVITGKAREEGPDGRGVLRRAVPDWLASPAFRAFVVGFEEANRGHGGGGALYVRVRRLRRHA